MDKKTFITLGFICVAIWGISIVVMYFLFRAPTTVHDFGDMFGAVNALFSGLALAGVIYAVLIQTEEIKNNQLQIEKSIKANEIAARLSAFSALLQECDSAPDRYERWEKNATGDYTKVKEKVRGNVKAYRIEIEILLEQLRS